MIKLRVGQEKDDVNPRLHGAGGNNVEAPVDDESNDQERNTSNKDDQDAKQKAKQQEHGDSAAPRATAKGASGHRSGPPGAASGDKDSNVSIEAGNPNGRGAGKHQGPLKRGKDSHNGLSFDEEAKERLTSEGGPVPDTGARRGDLDAPVTGRQGQKRHDGIRRSDR